MALLADLPGDPGETPQPQPQPGPDGGGDTDGDDGAEVDGPKAATGGRAFRAGPGTVALAVGVALLAGTGVALLIRFRRPAREG